MTTQKRTGVVDRAIFRSRVKAEILATLSMAPKVGRPAFTAIDRTAKAEYEAKKRAGLLSPTDKPPEPFRSRGDIIVVVRIINALLAEMKAAGEVLHLSLDFLLTESGKRRFASSILDRMSHVKETVAGINPQDRFDRATSELIKVRRIERNKLGGPGQYHYLLRSEARPLDLVAARNSIEIRSKRSQIRAFNVMNIFEEMIQTMSADQTVGDAISAAMNGELKRRESEAPEVSTRPRLV